MVLASQGQPVQVAGTMRRVWQVVFAVFAAVGVCSGAAETPEQRLTMAFQLAVGRKPSSAELRVLAEGFRYHQAKYRLHPALASELIRLGDHAIDEALDPAELAAYMVAANLILNLDETVTKE